MKVNELRLYNLLQYKNDVVPVVGLNIENEANLQLVQIRQANEIIPIHPQHLQPIRLTSEWLSKFGFKESYRSGSRIRFDLPKFGKYDFDLSKDKILEGFLYFGNYIRCHYIHQLQNLYFALTGEELELTAKQQPMITSLKNISLKTGNEYLKII